MSEIPTIERWLDIDSAEAKTMEYYPYIKRVVHSGLKFGIIKPDNMGNLYLEDGITPVHAELDGKVVGLRLTAKAAN